MFYNSGKWEIESCGAESHSEKECPEGAAVGDGSARSFLVLVHHPRQETMHEKSEGSLFRPFNKIKEQVTNNR